MVQEFAAASAAIEAPIDDPLVMVAALVQSLAAAGCNHVHWLGPAGLRPDQSLQGPLCSWQRLGRNLVVLVDGGVLYRHGRRCQQFPR